MNRPFSIFSARCFALLGLSGLLAVTAPRSAAADGTLGLPLFFEANQGQAPGGVRFVSRGCQQDVLIAPTEMVLDLATMVAPAPVMREKAFALYGTNMEVRSVQLQFVGADTNASVLGQGEMAGKVNYLIGNDPAKWHTGISTFSQVEVDGLYSGIDLRYHGNQHQVEYDFTVAPGGDPGVIAIHFTGADRVSIDEQGELVLRLGRREIRQPKPALYQDTLQGRLKIPGGYQLKDASTVVFAVGEYYHDLPLVIDPILSYSTYFGGSGNDIAWAVAVDTNGFAYLAGETLSPTFYTTSPSTIQPNYGGGTLNGDAFVAKLSTVTSNLVFFTYLGGSAEEVAFGMKVDAAGYVYLAGATTSPDFPFRGGSLIHTTVGSGTSATSYIAMNSPFDPVFNSHRPDAFVAKLSPGATNLIYALSLGGSSDDAALALALDTSANVYVTGYTYSTNFPVSTNFYDLYPPAQTNLNGSNDVFVTEISADGTTVPYSTYLGGSNVDVGEAIAADPLGNAYVAGYTFSTNFPVTLGNFATNRTLNGLADVLTASTFDDAFIAKLNTLATNIPAQPNNSLVFSALLGGSNYDGAYGITLDANNDPLIVGYTRSFDFPATFTPTAALTNGNIALNGAVSDVFLTKISSDGSNLLFGSIFGGTSFDVGNSVAVDPMGDVFVAGRTASVDFPTNSANAPLQNFNSGGYDVFVTAFDSTLTNVLYSVYLGGSLDDLGYSVAADQFGNAYVAGVSSSGNFPTTTNAFQPLYKGGTEAFLAKISLPAPLSISLTADATNGIDLSWPTNQPEYSLYSLESNTNIVSPTTWTSDWTNMVLSQVYTNGSIFLNLITSNNVRFFRLHRH